MEEIRRITSWYGKFPIIFAGFHTCWVVSRISSNNGMVIVESTSKDSSPRASAQRDGRPEPQPSSLGFKWSNKQAREQKKTRKTPRTSQHLEVDLART